MYRPSPATALGCHHHCLAWFAKKKDAPAEYCNDRFKGQLAIVILDAVFGGSGVSIRVGVVVVAAGIAVVGLKMFLLLRLLFQGVMMMFFPLTSCRS